MGTGDPIEDDYYYTRWKQRRVLEKLPDAWRVPEMKPKYYSFEDAYPSNYTPPTFAGSLGKPTHCTTSFPRQLIEVRNESPDDDEQGIGRGSSQKKLRAALMQIENAALLLLDCESIRNKMMKPDGQS